MKMTFLLNNSLVKNEFDTIMLSEKMMQCRSQIVSNECHATCAWNESVRAMQTRFLFLQFKFLICTNKSF
jgi:hypothetical protein